jgi:hypothetical protein
MSHFALISPVSPKISPSLEMTKVLVREERSNNIPIEKNSFFNYLTTTPLAVFVVFVVFVVGL